MRANIGHHPRPGYYEIYCQLCGVSFNINRSRTRSEPRSAAWADSSATTRNGLSWEPYNSYYDCPRDGDRRCCLVHRGLLPWQLEKREATSHGLYEDDPEDSVRDAGPTHEPPRKESNEDLPGYDSGLSAVGEEDKVKGDVASEDGNAGRGWTFSVQGPPPPTFDTEFLPLSTIDYLEDEEEDYDEGVSLQARREKQRLRREKRGEYEHVAGPDCQHTNCYNGHNISVEQMTDCLTAQCLYIKPDNWEPRPDDMAFEATSRYCLTGLAGNVPSGGYGIKFAPTRHGFAEGKVDNDDNVWIETEEDQRESGVAFHPACFEIFTVVSNLVLGKVDPDGLVRLRNLCCIGQVPTFADWADDVLSSRDQVWEHSPGTEYLAANPLFVPEFRTICERAMNQGDDFDVRQSPFEPRRQRDTSAAASSDPFLKLHVELVHEIVGYLDSQDIAALRASSRAFEHLPMSIWRRLLIDEMPFLYEAWRDDATPYNWACHDVQLLQTLRLHEEEWRAKRWCKARDLEDVDMEAHAAYLATTPEEPPWQDGPEVNKMLEEACTRRKATGPIALPRDRTNWYQLYRDIVTNWSHLLGLRNRERIWGTIHDICERIRSIQEGDQPMTDS
ncbi:hypothetical protein JDV02_000938 [Purpureocillium takamizusanense]|uniref:F-box domain-containing protein n=1 Tax=Purpureocillium takamizusanense TaxID=2060973 RepID=A0A9Q8Q843_9HYPO|nr:uncharacterized protein JDV02_000938 [Purpureocillium takamizusanense]UNI14294.1 hypothetical protein JDV02_000938 [Purpureocillium takamizusanense]